MTLSSSTHRTHTPLRARVYRLSLALLAAGAVTVGLASPGTAANGDLTQLTGPSGFDGCLSPGGNPDGCTVDAQLSAPKGVAVSPDGKHVYVANAGPAAVLAFIRTRTNDPALSKGALTPAGAFGAPGLSGLQDVIVSPDGKHVYVTGNNSVFFFSRNKTLGSLTFIQCVSRTAGTCTTPTVSSLNGPQGLAISKDGKSVYVAAHGLDGVLAFARNKSSGILAPVVGTSCVSTGGPSDGCNPGVALNGATGVAISQDGSHVYVTADVADAVAILSRNKKNGTLTQLSGVDGCWSQTGAGPCQNGRGLNGAHGITLTQDGKFLYVASPSSNAISIFSRNKKTGTLAQPDSTAACVSQDGEDGSSAGQCLVAGVGGLKGVQEVVVSQDGKNLYASAETSDAVDAFSRNKSTGALTQLSCLSSSDPDCGAALALNGALGIAITRDGKNVYVTAVTDDAIANFARK